MVPETQAKIFKRRSPISIQMPIQNDIQTYSIIPFDKNHQAEVNELMSEIQKEFDTFFSSPLSASISDRPR
jgi:hypothetical protein